MVTNLDTTAILTVSASRKSSICLLHMRLECVVNMVTPRQDLLRADYARDKILLDPNRRYRSKTIGDASTLPGVAAQVWVKPAAKR